MGFYNILHFLCSVLSAEGLYGDILCSVFFFLSAISIIANYFRALEACAVSDGDVESEDTNCCLLFQQERTRSFDGFSMHSLENSLIDIMRAEQDSLKGTLFPH